MRTPRGLGAVLVVALLLATLGSNVGALRTQAMSWLRRYASVQDGVQQSAPAQDDGQNASDWPQVQNNPQRNGYTPEVFDGALQVAWTHPFQPQKVHPQVQAIVYDGVVFVGTEMGKLYALDAQTGELQWVYEVGAPILNSVAAAAVGPLGNGAVFLGAMDGAVYALNVESGALLWKSSLSEWQGFSTAPLLADGKVMLGGRDGVFYALDPATGMTLWEYAAGSPILQTAAWNDGQAFFGTMDMRVHAVNTGDGTRTWRSVRLPGLAFKDYWPVVHDGQVFVRPMGPGGIDAGFPFNEVWASNDPNWDWVMQHGATIAAGRLADIPEAMDAQDDVLADYEAFPGRYTVNLFILDEDTGRESFVVPHWTVQTMNGATTPPCVDRDGMLIVPVTFVRSGWARLDLASQRVTDILYDHTNWNGEPMAPGQYPAGMGNRDENLNVTCTGNLVLALHTEEGNANYTGAFDLDKRAWIRIGAGHTSSQMSTNTQGGGGNAASVSNALVYHISFHELIARKAQP